MLVKLSEVFVLSLCQFVRRRSRPVEVTVTSCAEETAHPWDDGGFRPTFLSLQLAPSGRRPFSFALVCVEF
jgi:hypothetical protein